MSSTVEEDRRIRLSGRTKQIDASFINPPDGKGEEGIISSCESNSSDCKTEKDTRVLNGPSTSDLNESGTLIFPKLMESKLDHSSEAFNLVMKEKKKKTRLCLSEFRHAIGDSSLPSQV